MACILLLTVSACDNECITGSGPIVTQTLALDDFSSFTMMGSGRVVLTQGNTQTVRVEGQQNIINQLNRDVRGGHWDIFVEECVRRSDQLTFYITVPAIDHVALTGSGRIESTNVIESQAISVILSGSGDIELDIDTDEVDAAISGSGTIDLSGDADYSDLDISGSGSFRAFGMETRESDVTITGSGSCRVLVEDMLRVRISGSGNVYYRGDPQLEVDITGSGKVEKG